MFLLPFFYGSVVLIIVVLTTAKDGIYTVLGHVLLGFNYNPVEMSPEGWVASEYWIDVVLSIELLNPF